MKIQSLAVIFIIIIMPITMVLSEYVNNKITTEMLELEYDTRLLNSTYDAIKAYQINTINNSFGDVTNSKINDLEAAAKTFYNSIASNFNYTGYKSDVMKEYVPALAFTMYDGYYIYSPFRNTLTEVKYNPDDPANSYDKDYSEDGEYMEGLKPYVYYSCRYKRTLNGYDDDFIITYTLDNYITIQGMIQGDYRYDYGYLYSIDGDKKLKYDSSNNIYLYKDVKFKNDFTTYGAQYRENLREYLDDKKEYHYVKINGTKYYLDDTAGAEKIFYINSDGSRSNQVTKAYNETLYNKYVKAIEKNISAYEYYRKAYEFTHDVIHKYELNKLTYGNAVVSNDENGTTKFVTDNNKDTLIFDDSNTNLENADSNFNQHRRDVIRYVIETNLSAAISGFSSKAASNFIMPKISETDWETIENNVCAISFMQGMSIGAKKYNGYSVVANTLTKEYVDENDIYILGKDGALEGTYLRVNDDTIAEGSTYIQAKANLGYYSGVWKINFEQKRSISTGTATYYFPMIYNDGTSVSGYLGSYTSIMGVSGLKETSLSNYRDMYDYLDSNNKAKTNTVLKTAYLYALGRERWGAFNINNINYTTTGSNSSEEYFLKAYE